MNDHDRASAYLTIPRSYGDALGGLWWSSEFDAIERRDGTTLAVAAEIRAVLEGVIARPPVPAFVYVLNCLHIMKTGAAGFKSLHAAFASTRGSVNRGRNAGLLIAELCRGVPSATRVTSEHVSLALQSLRRYGDRHRPDAIPEPPLTRAEFEHWIADLLVSFDDAALVHWLTHGCGPGGVGARLAEETESLPERVARLLTLARRRLRLAGAAALVPALDAALTLPPRGHPPNALPLGGYCDVTTRGDPERLLPSQFALDPDEFVRRFAGNELLYFKREDPHEAVRPDRIIVLDQGVRTWGSVRLALAAAAFSLLRVNAKRCGAVRLFATSVSGTINLLSQNAGAVGEQLEASDLTPHPAECLALALQTDDDPAPRDVILLTHRRSLNELGVATAAASRAPSDRLFALSVDESGNAELSEWATSGPLALRSFRVDLVAAESARPEEAARPNPSPAQPAGPWTGDVEPVPFPFRPGLVVEPLHLGFAADGDWLVIAGRDGILHGLTLDGSPPEVLPRAFGNGVVLKHVGLILGVTGGVVVCGRMFVLGGPTVSASEPAAVTTVAAGAPVVSSGASDSPTVEHFVAVHYDLTARKVTLHAFNRAEGEPGWATHPNLHCITLRTATGAGCALDLATLGRFPYSGPPATTLISRACLAWDRAAKGGAGPHDLPITFTLPPGESEVWNAPFLQLVGNGTVYPRQTPRTWYAVTPQRDGKALLVDAELHRAQLVGDVLALAYTKAAERNLVLLRSPDGAVLGDVEFRAGFALSLDGRLLARRSVDRIVTVSETTAPARTIVNATQAALHDALKVVLDADPFQLTIIVGGHQHTFHVANGALLYKSRWELSDQTQRTHVAFCHSPTDYDPARFPRREAVSVSGWLAVVDRLGQVLLFRGDTGRLVAVFLIRRERAAAWIPGGVFWGDTRLIGGPATPDAGQKIGQAIVAAGFAREGVKV